VAWRTPLECQCTPESTLSQSALCGCVRRFLTLWEEMQITNVSSQCSIKCLDISRKMNSDEFRILQDNININLTETGRK
jgi:hypothetical protein